MYSWADDASFIQIFLLLAAVNALVDMIIRQLAFQTIL